MKLLLDDYYYYLINENEFSKIFNENRKDVFEENIDFNVKKVLSELEKNKLKKLKDNSGNDFKLFIKISKAEKIIGWFFGKQSDEETFKMINTGILKEYRNKGIYNSLLKEIFEIIKEEGFQKIESHHHANNNQVIVPKLKAGFTITGLEIEDKFGMMIKLTYYFNKKRQKIIDFRIGSKKLNKEFEKYLNLWE